MREPRARFEGVDEETVVAISDPESPLLTPREHAAVDFVERLFDDHHSITAKTWRQLKNHFAESELIELTMLAQWHTGMGRLQSALLRYPDWLGPVLPTDEADESPEVSPSAL